jgi:hypothetical protein
VGDDAVICIGGYGLFATAKITTPPKRRLDWPNRYGAGVESVRLIKPPISLDVLQQRLPALKWTIYPRSITTPRPEIAERLWALIHQRRARGAADINENELAAASLAELRAAALARSARRASQHEMHRIERKRARRD